MASKIRPLKFGLKYSPPSIILEYQLGEKKRRRVMPVRNLTPDSDVHDIVDKLIDAHSQLDPGIVPTEQVVRLVQKLIDNTKPVPSPIKTTPTNNPLAPLAPLKTPTPSQPLSSQPELKLFNNKDHSNGLATNGKDTFDVAKDLKNSKDNKPTDIKDNKLVFGDKEKEKEKDIKATQDKDIKSTQEKEKEKEKENEKVKEEPVKPQEKPTPAPLRPPVLGSLPGLSKLGGLPSLSQPLQPLSSKPAALPASAPTTNKEKTFRHALDSDEDEDDDDLLGDHDDLDDLLDEDKLRRSLSDLDIDESDNDDRDFLKKEDFSKKKPVVVNEPLHSDDDSYRSDEDDEPVYNKAGKGSVPAPAPNKHDLDSDSYHSDEDEDLIYKPKTGSAPAPKRNDLDLNSDDDLYNDEFLEEVEEEDINSDDDEDLNKLSDNELKRRKADMNVSFEKNRKLPGDPGFKYDVQKTFAGNKPSEWDEDEVDDDF